VSTAVPRSPRELFGRGDTLKLERDDHKRQIKSMNEKKGARSCKEKADIAEGDGDNE